MADNAAPSARSRRGAVANRGVDRGTVSAPTPLTYRVEHRVGEGTVVRATGRTYIEALRQAVGLLRLPRGVAGGGEVRVVDERFGTLVLRRSLGPPPAGERERPAMGRPTARVRALDAGEERSR